MKNPKDLFPWNLKATHRKLVTAEPRRATSADAIRELGRGRNRSRTMPIRGAPMTIDVSEYFPVVAEEFCPTEPDDSESPQ